MIQDLTLHPRPQSGKEVLYKIKINLKFILLEFWQAILRLISSRHARREK